MAENFEKLEKQMDPERLARAKAKAKEVIAEIALAENSKEADMPQDHNMK